LIELNQRGVARRRKEPKKRYQHASEMDKYMKDALRVRKPLPHFYLIINYLLWYRLVITILYLARSILEFSENGKSAKHRRNLRIPERSCNKDDCTEFNENSWSRHLPYRGRCRVRDDPSKAPSSERQSQNQKQVRKWKEKRDRTEAPKLKTIGGKYKYYILPVFVIYLRVFII